MCYACGYIASNGEIYLLVLYGPFTVGMLFWGMATINHVGFTVTTALFVPWCQKGIERTKVTSWGACKWASVKTLGSSCYAALPIAVVEQLTMLQLSLSSHKYTECLEGCEDTFNCVSKWRQTYNKWATAQMILNYKDPEMSGILENGKEAFERLKEEDEMRVHEASIVPHLLNKAAFCGALVTASVTGVVASASWKFTIYFLFIGGCMSFVFAYCIITGILQPFYACDAALPVVLADGSNFSQRHQDMFNSLEEAFQVHQEVATADKLQEAEERISQLEAEAESKCGRSLLAETVVASSR